MRREISYRKLSNRFKEPRLLIVSDPRTDRQAVIEASYVNIPCIALCDTDSSLEFVDVAIPCNNRSKSSLAMIYWMLAREVKILRGELTRDDDWDVLVDLFIYRSVEELANKDEEKAEDDEDIQNEKAGNWDAAKEGEDKEEDAWVE